MKRIKAESKKNKIDFVLVKNFLILEHSRQYLNLVSFTLELDHLLDKYHLLGMLHHLKEVFY